MLEAKVNLIHAMNECKPKSIVYELYEKYDNSYQRMKHPNDKDKSDYIDLYFRYLDYMNKLSGSQK
jgi:hypothetical protein